MTKSFKKIGDSKTDLDSSTNSTSLTRPFLSTDEDTILSTINQRLRGDSVKDASEFGQGFDLLCPNLIKNYRKARQWSTVSSRFLYEATNTLSSRF